MLIAAVIVTLDSVRPRTLIISITTAQTREDASASHGPTASTSIPGRRTTTVPAKPTAIAVQRRARTRSPNTTTASSVAKIGAEKARAVTWVSGVRLSAVKKLSIATALTAARSACSPNRRVRSGSSPRRTSHGTTTSTPNRLRKNAISKG